MITAKITLTDVGADTGPLFNLYSDANSYSAAFATNITKLELINGYSSDVVPDGTAIIKVQSVDNTLCPGFVLLEIPGITTTTTSSSTVFPGYYTYYFSVGRSSSFQSCGETPPFDNTFYSDSIALDLDSVLYTNSSLTTPVAGGNQWFFLGSDFISYQVNNSGVIVDFFNCL